MICEPTCACTPRMAHPGAVLDPLDQLRRGRGRQPELRALVPGQHVRVGVGGDAGDDPDQDVLGPAGRHDRLQPVDVVGTVDNHQADAVLDRHGDLFGALRVAVQHDQRRVDAGLERGEDLPAAGDVQPETLLHHHPLDRGAGKGLGREHHSGMRPALGERGPVLAGPLPQRVLGDHQHRRAELAGEVVGPAAADGQHPVGVLGAARREQVQQLVSRHLAPADLRGLARFGLCLHCLGHLRRPPPPGRQPPGPASTGRS